MKVTPAHLARLRAAVSVNDTPEVRDRYRRRDFPRADAVKDLDTRYRWDLLWACPGISTWISDNGYTTAHIDTALRAIVKPLGEATS